MPNIPGFFAKPEVGGSNQEKIHLSYLYAVIAKVFLPIGTNKYLDRLSFVSAEYHSKTDTYVLTFQRNSYLETRDVYMQM